MLDLYKLNPFFTPITTFVICSLICLCSFVCFVALLPKSTAMAMVMVMTLFPGKLKQAINQYFEHILSLVTDNDSAEGRSLYLQTIWTPIRVHSVCN